MARPHLTYHAQLTSATTSITLVKTKTKQFPFIADLMLLCLISPVIIHFVFFLSSLYSVFLLFVVGTHQVSLVVLNISFMFLIRILNQHPQSQMSSRPPLWPNPNTGRIAEGPWPIVGSRPDSRRLVKLSVKSVQ